MQRQAIIATFKQFESLYASMEAASDSEKQDEASRRIEAYREGPFAEALEETEYQECQKQDAELLRALLSAILHSLGSANEAPYWTLGSIFICQPELVSEEFKALRREDQRELFGLLEFGFGNVVEDKVRNKAQAKKLAAKLRALDPGNGA